MYNIDEIGYNIHRKIEKDIMKKILVIKMIALLVVVAVVSIFEAFWLQSIIEHFNGSIHILASIAIILVLGALTAGALQGLLLLSLFVTQCYIWLF